MAEVNNMDLMCKTESLEMLDAILGIENGKDDFPNAYITAIENIPNTCGVGLTWSLNEEKNSEGAATGNYILSIDGTGETYNWATYEKTPWAKTNKAPITELKLGDSVEQLGKNLIEDNSTSIKLGSNYIALYSSNFTEAYEKNGAIKIECNSIGHFLNLDRLLDSGVESSDRTLWIEPIINGETITSIEVSSDITDLGPLSLSSLKGVTSITIPKEVITGLEDALYFTEDLELLTIDKENPSYSVRRLVTDESDGTTKTRYLQLTNKDGTKLLKMYGASDGDYTILDGISSIDEYAFNVLTATTGWEEKSFNLTIYGTKKISIPYITDAILEKEEDETQSAWETRIANFMKDRFKQFFGFEPVEDTTETNHKLYVATGMRSVYAEDSFWKYFGTSNINEIT
jgi:hypothetical protein